MNSGEREIGDESKNNWDKKVGRVGERYRSDRRASMRGGEERGDSRPGEAKEERMEMSEEIAERKRSWKLCLSLFITVTKYPRKAT
jgi:hypothetical protein